MPKYSTFPIESLVEIHDTPFLVIDETLTIIAVNSQWDRFSNISRLSLIGKRCCLNIQQCRHREFFKTEQPYSGYFDEDIYSGAQKKDCLITGYAIRSSTGKLFIGERLTQINQCAEVQSPMMVGISPLFMKLQSKLMQIAKTNVPVLLSGETGTGKEVAAQFIHAHSERAHADFVVVDCTLLTENLFESELFGHEKGAFTNAISAKKGLFEMAHNGTLFLDEIGELPLSQQPKLLRALESGQFRRVGGVKTLNSNVRAVCATHRNLGEMVKQGLFREDLFYRLSVLSVDIPPLRDRKQDLPLLADFLLKQEGATHTLSQAALTKLLHHSWPGNIRELKNCLQLASAMALTDQIDKQDIHILRRRPRPEQETEVPYLEPRDAYHNLPEKELIHLLVEKFQGNRRLIAAEMNISERTLYRKLSRYNLS